MKIAWIQLVLIAMIVTGAGGPLAAQPVVVSPRGPVATLSAAIALSEPGGHILVKPGVYYESDILVDKPLTITGEGYPVFDARAEEGKEILIIAADGVTVQGLTLRNVAKSYLKDLAALRVRRHDRFVIRDNHLEDTFFGIYLEKASDGVVADNHIQGQAVDEASSGNAIHAWYCERLLVENNTVRGHRDGIYFEFVNESEVRGNRSEDNIRYGLHFMFSNDDRYTRNVFRGNGAGVAVMFSKQIDMLDNRFTQNWGRASYGLLLKEIYDAEIRRNVFEQNTIGINIEGSTRVNYFRNDFDSNGWAVRMAGGCLENHFSGNNFRGNSLDLVVNGHTNDNTFDGNYWSEYAGYDLDHDGTGDVPYRPVKLFSYILNRSPEAIVLLRSFFVDLINFSEKVSPVFTPADVFDHQPKMQPLP